MFTVYAIHAPQADRLEEVKAEMARLGAPKIEVVDCGDHYRALEGSHRLAAAHAANIEPNLIIWDQDDLIDVTKYDWYDEANWSETEYMAGEVAGELFAPTSAVAYSFPAIR